MSHHAPSRAARLDTIARLALAEHAAELLASKEEALQRERTRLAGHESRSRDEWVQRCTDAANTLLRARAMGASDELAALVARREALATVTAKWTDSMGITYPGDVACTPRTPPGLTGTAALAPARNAHHDALVAAAAHASTATALQRLNRELADTRRRRRAIADHLVPVITEELHTLELTLDEQDREEAVRIQLAVSRREPTEHAWTP